MKLKRALVDFSQICYAAYYGNVMKDDDLDSEEDKILYFKHSLLSRLADYQQKFSFNEMILCVDSGSWRADVFPYYKGKRKEDRAKDPEKTRLLYECIDSLLLDIEHMNYKMVRVAKAEADDIIAVLARKFQADPDTESVMIISTDKDFQQITGGKVSLYSPLKNEIITCENKDIFLLKLILGGDTSDGIPNVRSDDDTFINSDKRQKACGEKAIEKILLEGIETHLVNDAMFRKNYERNQRLITLSKQYIPENIWAGIEEEYTKKLGVKRKNAVEIGNYFRMKNLNGLMSRLNDFV